MKINFPHHGWALGRNGTMHTIGLEIMESGSQYGVILTPITSKGQPGRCEISIPDEVIPQVIMELQKQYHLCCIKRKEDEQKSKSIQDRAS